MTNDLMRIGSIVNELPFFQAKDSRADAGEFFVVGDDDRGQAVLIMQAAEKLADRSGAKCFD